VAAGLVGEATAWPWSSAAGRPPGRTDAVAEGDWLSDRIGGWVCTWGEYLAESDGEETGRLLHRHESTGRPLGDRSFVEQVSAAIGRDLVPKKPGRKPKKEK
jgi:putative transposase